MSHSSRFQFKMSGCDHLDDLENIAFSNLQTCLQIYQKYAESFPPFVVPSLATWQENIKDGVSALVGFSRNLVEQSKKQAGSLGRRAEETKRLLKLEHRFLQQDLEGINVIKSLQRDGKKNLSGYLMTPSQFSLEQAKLSELI